MIVSIVGTGDWPARRTGGPAVRTASAAAIASLLEQINALVQRIGHVAGGVVPFRKIQGCVHPAGDLPQAARDRKKHTSELQSLAYLVCRLLLEKKKKKSE